MDKKMLTSVPPEEVQLLVSSTTTALGNRMRENILSFEALSTKIQFSQLYEKGHFQHRVFTRSSSITSLWSNSWENNCWTSYWSSNRENYWKIWVRDFNASIFHPWETSYVVISRETERFVDEIHDHKKELRSSSQKGKNLVLKKEDPIASEGKSICLCWFRSMCWTDERHSRSNGKMGKSSGRTQVVFVLPKWSGYRWRSNWIRVEKFTGFSSLSILQEIQQDMETRRIQPTGSSLRQCSMTLIEKRMMIIDFRMPRESRITRWNSRKDFGRKKRGMEVLLTLRKENGNLQPTTWYSDSKKLVILCSKASVLWVAES